MKNIILLVFCSMVFGHLFSQNYDIRLNRGNVNCATNEVCYNVQLRHNGTGDFGLAGQNYRIFYDNAVASFVSGTSSLTAAYSGFTLVQNLQNIDASSINGPLNFESNLGFLNYTMDLNDTQNGGVFLPADGGWMTTSNICFIVDEEVFLEPNLCMDVVWARESLTNMYGTAYVEVSRWVGSNNTVSSLGIIYDDLNSLDGEEACLNTICSVASISVHDITVFENVGNAAVDVCLSTISGEEVTVVVNTSNGTAVSGLDFTAIVNLTLTIPTGQMCAQVLIPIIDDLLFEGTEFFNVLLSNPSPNATIIDGTGIVTIFDNEGPCNAHAPTLSGY